MERDLTREREKASKELQTRFLISSGVTPAEVSLAPMEASGRGWTGTAVRGMSQVISGTARSRRRVQVHQVDRTVGERNLLRIRKAASEIHSEWKAVRNTQSAEPDEPQKLCQFIPVLLSGC